MGPTEKNSLTDTDSVSFLKNILDSSIEYSIIALSLDGIILTWNKGAERTYGYTAEEMTGKPISCLHLPADAQSGRVQKFMDVALKNNKAEDIFERIRKNGEHFTASVVVTLRQDSAGKVIGYLFISKDITEQKQLEEQLRINDEMKKQRLLQEKLRKIQELEEENKHIQESNRLKNQFLANISHELRTPLNAVIGFSDLMHEETMGPINPEQKDALHDIIISARHLLRIIDDILDLSKIEADKITFYPQNCNLKNLIDEVSNSLRAELKIKQIDYTVHVEENTEQVYLDPSRFKQILYNLLSNAIKFTPDLGTIQVRLKPEGVAHICLEIEDNGIGIREEDFTKIFTSFNQLDYGENRRQKGTGLGLSLTKQLVEAQNGKIGLQSTFGKGSLFYAILPRQYPVQRQYPARPQYQGQSQAEARSVSMTAASKKVGPNILVIEDNLINLKLIKMALIKYGFKIQTTTNAEDALTLLKDVRPDLILMDIQLPGMNGLQLTQLLKKNPATKKIIILALTAFAMPRDKEKAIQAGCDGFISKPVDIRALPGIITKFFTHKSA